MDILGNNKSINKYSREFKIPSEFPEILRELTREILRNNPKDINRFGKFSNSYKLKA
jgi:hypothetical protein